MSAATFACSLNSALGSNFRCSWSRTSISLIVGFSDLQLLAEDIALTHGAQERLYRPLRLSGDRIAVTAAAQPQELTRAEVQRVIFASSLGTVFEWYDF